MSFLRNGATSLFALAVLFTTAAAEIMGSATARERFVFGGLERWQLPGMVVGPFFL